MFSGEENEKKAIEAGGLKIATTVSKVTMSDLMDSTLPHLTGGGR